MASPGSLGFSWVRSRSVASRETDTPSPGPGAENTQSTHAHAHPQNIAAATVSSPASHREPIRSFVSGGGRDRTGTCGVRLGTLMATSPYVFRIRLGTYESHVKASKSHDAAA